MTFPVCSIAPVSPAFNVGSPGSALPCITGPGGSTCSTDLCLTGQTDRAEAFMQGGAALTAVLDVARAYELQSGWLIDVKPAEA